jgi:putative endonuclease
MSQPDRGRVSPPGPAAGPSERSYYLFILSTPGRGLTLGVTNDLARCLVERRLGAPPGRTSPLEASRLVYFEVISDLGRALTRKQQLEGWNRSRKWRLILSLNPDWRDLSVGLAGLSR